MTTPQIDITEALNLVAGFLDEGNNLETFAIWLAQRPSHDDAAAIADKANACANALRECAEALSNEGPIFQDGLI